MNAESLPLTITEVDLTEPAPSPFLPGTHIQYAFDSTSLGYFKRCPRLYQYVMIEGWEPREDSADLFFGAEFHTALEHFDRLRAEGLPFGESIRAVVGDLICRTAGYAPDPETKAGKYKSRENLLGLVVDYLDFYRDDKAETYILEDGRPAVELSFRFELDWGPQTEARTGWGPDAPEAEPQPYILCGHLDRVVTFSGELFVMDRKTTTSTLGSYYFDKYEPDNQMTLYTLASRIILGSPVRGVIVDGCQILLDKPHNFSRGITYRTPDQLDEWLKDLERWLALAESYAAAEYWPMNDLSCDKYGGCKFREICSKSPAVRERFLESKFQKRSEPWNPLAISG